MRILYDLSATQPNNQSKFHGGGEYAKVVFEKLIQLKKNEEIVAFYNPNKWLDPSIYNIIEKENINIIKINNNEKLQSVVSDFDKFYTVLPGPYSDLDFRNVICIFTINGLRNIEMPTDKYEFKYRKNCFSKLKCLIQKKMFLKKYINRNKLIFDKLLKIKAKDKIFIVISLHTKYALLTYFPKTIDINKKVLYCPRKLSKNCDDIQIREEEIFLKSKGLKKRGYFLIISADRWQKNSYRAIKAFDDLFANFSSINKNVVILGLERNIFKIKNEKKFLFLHYAKRKDLNILYKNSYSFIYPTLNEGFGYPPLESMKFGIPVICSAITSTTEICSFAALYFNPFSIEELQNRILMLLFEEGIWGKYSNLSKKRYKEISLKQDKMLSELCELILSK